MDIAAIISLINAGIDLTATATKALEAANDGDEEKATEYLKDARDNYAKSRSAFDAVAGL